MPTVRLWGSALRLHPSVLLLLAVLAWMGEADRWSVLFASVLLHELAHAAAACRLGVRVYEVELLPFGGVAHVDEPAMVPPSAEVRVALSGPAVNAALALAFWGAATLVVGRDGWSCRLNVWAMDQAGLAVFNLLPAFPLDGGRVARALLASRIGFERASRLAVRVGRIGGVAMAACGLISYGLAGSGLWPAAVGAMVAWAAEQERRRAPGVWMRYLERQAREMRPADVREVRALAAPVTHSVREVLRWLVPGRYHVVVLTDASGRAVGLADEQIILRAVSEGALHVPIGRLPWRRL